MIKIEDFNDYELDRFRKVQSIANECATTVAAELCDGITEREAAKRMDIFMKDNGVTQYFHQPFAWFGDRTAFNEFKNELAFFPTTRRLREGMPFILDVAPCIDGYSADIGYVNALGENQKVQQMRQELLDFRTLILEEVKAGCSFEKIYKDVDAHIESLGYKNAHHKYPQRVLAHRVGKMKENFFSKYRLFGFGIPHLQWLATDLVKGLVRADQFTPTWNDRKESDHAPLPGLWAVEPHIATKDGSIGAKWEEILVITEDDAYWLDDAVPHVTELKS